MISWSAWSLFHEAVRSIFERLLRADVRLWMTAQNAVEFWAVSTKSQAANGIGLSVAQAELQLRSLETMIHLLPESPAVHARWRRIVQQLAVQGRQVYDARLVASMETYNIGVLLTKNTRDFARYASVEAIDPEHADQWGT